VKIQHRGLRETSAGDIFALCSIVGIAERIFDGFSWGWIADEIAPHLPRELDFVNEGKNSERAAADLQKTGLACVIPKVLWTHSSPRVLTMEFEEGFKATDIDAIEKAGLKKQDVAKLISSVFSSQVFLSAFVHCDPHPANVLLRANKKGKPEVVLVDHGLYRELDTDFQLRYSKLWKSLMLADLHGIKDACHSLGVDEAYTLFAAMLTARPFDEIIERSKKGSLSQHVNPDSGADKAVIRAYVQQYIHNIFDLLGTIPREMLMLLKMNDCLRHIDYSLGSPTNTIVVCGQYAARAVYQDNLRQNPSFLGMFQAWMSYMQVMARIQVHDLGVWWLEQKRRTVLRLS
jgi:aarF domain-containing kinase